MSDTTVETAENPQFYLTEEHHPENSTMLGFWLYLMSDCLIFAVLFCHPWRARSQLCGRPLAGRSLRSAACGDQHGHAAVFVDHLRFCHAADGARQAAQRADLAGDHRRVRRHLPRLELYEFAHLIHEGAGPQRSAFLSSFFTLVGTHGLHVTFGIVWLITLMVQVSKHGLIAENKRRLMCLSMFWHFLDVVWIGVFSFVYLMGVVG